MREQCDSTADVASAESASPLPSSAASQPPLELLIATAAALLEQMRISNELLTQIAAQNAMMLGADDDGREEGGEPTHYLDGTPVR